MMRGMVAEIPQPAAPSLGGCGDVVGTIEDDRARYGSAGRIHRDAGDKSPQGGSQRRAQLFGVANVIGGERPCAMLAYEGNSTPGSSSYRQRDAQVGADSVRCHRRVEIGVTFRLGRSGAKSSDRTYASALGERRIKITIGPAMTLQTEERPQAVAFAAHTQDHRPGNRIQPADPIGVPVVRNDRTQQPGNRFAELGHRTDLVRSAQQIA